MPYCIPHESRLKLIFRQYNWLPLCDLGKIDIGHTLTYYSINLVTPFIMQTRWGATTVSSIDNDDNKILLRMRVVMDELVALTKPCRKTS